MTSFDGFLCYLKDPPVYIRFDGLINFRAIKAQIYKMWNKPIHVGHLDSSFWLLENFVKSFNRMHIGFCLSRTNFSQTWFDFCFSCHSVRHDTTGVFSLCVSDDFHYLTINKIRMIQNSYRIRKNRDETGGRDSSSAIRRKLPKHRFKTGLRTILKTHMELILWYHSRCVW